MKKTLMAAALVIALCASIAVPAWAAPSADESTVGTPKLAAQQTQSGKWTINKKAGTYVTKAQKKLFKKVHESRRDDDASIFAIGWNQAIRHVEALIVELLGVDDKAAYEEFGI